MVPNTLPGSAQEVVCGRELLHPTSKRAANGGREDRLCAEDLPTNTGDPNPTMTRYMPQTLTRRSACENRKEYQTGAQALDKNR